MDSIGKLFDDMKQDANRKLSASMGVEAVQEMTEFGDKIDEILKGGDMQGFYASLELICALDGSFGSSSMAAYKCGAVNYRDAVARTHPELVDELDALFFEICKE